MKTRKARRSSTLQQAALPD